MIAYCNNNPPITSDPTGEFLGTLIGAGVGWLVGGISAAVEGENFFDRAKEGAVSGAIAGLAVDVGVATGGVGGVAIAFVGGAIASDVETNMKDARRGTHTSTGERIFGACLGGALNLLSFGLVDSSAMKTGGNVLKNVVVNGNRQLFANATRQTAGKTVGKVLGICLGDVAWKGGKAALKNTAFNLIESVGETAIIGAFSKIFSKGVSVNAQ